MSAPGEVAQERERVLCHGCDNEWWKDEHGLECPRCHCDIVEIVGDTEFPVVILNANIIDLQINPNDDPRYDHLNHARSPNTMNNDDSLPRHPLHDHNPWQHDPPGRNDENIEHVAFSPAPGIHFEQTFIRSSGAGTNPRGRNPNEDVIGSLFQAFGGLLQGANNANRPDGSPQTRGMMFEVGPQFASQNPFPPPNQHRHIHGVWGQTPPGAGRNTYTAEARIFPQDVPGRNTDPLNNLHAIMQTVFASMQANMRDDAPPHLRGNGPGAGGAGFSLPDFLRQALDPANAVHGDAVFSQEAFDRIIGQMMEQNGGSTAPGPASAAAIAALPKKTVDKNMMGSDGTAECSVCMDGVNIGDEVTVLPCNHWFHEQCVGIWLKEHDTCPHCRKGIMPANGEPNAPRAPNQTPRHNRNPFGPPAETADPQTSPAQAPFTQPGMQHPYVPGGYPAYPEPQQYVQPPFQPQGITITARFVKTELSQLKRACQQRRELFEREWRRDGLVQEFEKWE
ncbi:MAG: hypothetical protein Q9217_001294 [Psora testacea]